MHQVYSWKKHVISVYCHTYPLLYGAWRHFALLFLRPFKIAKHSTLLITQPHLGHEEQYSFNSSFSSVMVTTLPTQHNPKALQALAADTSLNSQCCLWWVLCYFFRTSTPFSRSHFLDPCRHCCQDGGEWMAAVMRQTVCCSWQPHFPYNLELCVCVCVTAWDNRTMLSET